MLSVNRHQKRFNQFISWILLWCAFIAGDKIDTVIVLQDKEMSFDLETFVAAPTVSELNGLTKANLLTVALHYKLSTTDSMTKM